MKRLLHIALLLLVITSCSRSGRVIPRARFSKLYAEMFLADQWLKEHPGEKTKADTTLFYDPIFKRFGYTFEDYDASINYYLADPQKYSKILKSSSTYLRTKARHFRKLGDEARAVRQRNAGIRGYRRKTFEDDTILWRRLSDSISLDSLVLDSLMLDSLRRDSLRLDSLRLDSLRIDSLLRDSLRLDSLAKLEIRTASRVDAARMKFDKPDRNVKRGNRIWTNP